MFFDLVFEVSCITFLDLFIFVQQPGGPVLRACSRYCQRSFCSFVRSSECAAACAFWCPFAFSRRRQSLLHQWTACSVVRVHFWVSLVLCSRTACTCFVLRRPCVWHSCLVWWCAAARQGTLCSFVVGLREPCCGRTRTFRLCAWTGLHRLFLFAFLFLWCVLCVWFVLRSHSWGTLFAILWVDVFLQQSVQREVCLRGLAYWKRLWLAHNFFLQIIYYNINFYNLLLNNIIISFIYILFIFIIINYFILFYFILYYYFLLIYIYIYILLIYLKN